MKICISTLLKQFLFLTVILLYSHKSSAQGLTSITNFGSNPGNINAYSHVPSNMPNNAPLVVVMHGCTETAAGIANETAWNTLADAHKFYLVYAEQKSANNVSTCFNYWQSNDFSRGQGEAESIKQMVDYMKTTYSIDNSRVFATGLSAGGAFTAVMCSAYPDVFAAGAAMAGLAYKVATSSTAVYTAAGGFTSKTAQQWGDLARAEMPGYTGSYPRMAIFHGTSDNTINKNNATELVKQFTNLHGTDQTVDYTYNSFNGSSFITLKQYVDANNKIVVEHYEISGMAHGVAVDPGTCYQQGGVAGSLAFDVNLYSAFWAARFFGILQLPYSITGSTTVGVNQQNVLYSVPTTSGSTYNWTVPTGASIVNGLNSNCITVNWGTTNGVVSVTEMPTGGCEKGPVDLFVNMGTTGLQNFVESKEEILLNRTNENTECLLKSTLNSTFSIYIYDLSGRIVYQKNELNANQNYLIDQKFASGIYILNCITSTNKLMKKLVVE